MLDHYIHGSATRISPEAPVPVVLKSNDQYYLGGAGNVFSNILSLGGDADILSVIGNDLNGDKILELLNLPTHKSMIIRSSERKTTTKTRIVSGHHQMLRIDDEITSQISEDLENKIIGLFNNMANFYSGVILEDYNKGLLTPKLIEFVINKCKILGIPVIVDPKNKNINSYIGSTILKPNFSEFCNMVGKSIDPSDIDSIRKYACDFRNEMKLDSLIITMAERGIYICSEEVSFLSKGFNVNVSDVSGAGDTVLAVLSLCYVAGVDIEKILELCNLAGSIACTKSGAVSITLDEILDHPYVKDTLKKTTTSITG